MDIISELEDYLLLYDKVQNMSSIYHQLEDFLHRFYKLEDFFQTSRGVLTYLCKKLRDKLYTYLKIRQFLHIYVIN